ncbi:cAMP-dependent protein kinase catalytic subunit TPK3 KNAG_0C01060 [Huiozyma naganishii CBS 8797]|uniref:cAMP-dependent protein kinase n=1 Tax=Huiozyma naganishii (strain ATCC MYA-139 / BCRC 22969 / CBS 8797 / KCTC 17520 / NBRC 10181 / NCYC 3082 / Yp74L-3) TaxID=1071383 RepID=J7S4C2_HUIN7|nr:hypothetical protein KNAG_0C01060 [Kazachstania naganishii CBS 8797]CCK69219.1 hypothetical protein KNAG_0C01060 [Kazachstania naganishii CBS 8797]
MQFQRKEKKGKVKMQDFEILDNVTFTRGGVDGLAVRGPRDRVEQRFWMYLDPQSNNTLQKLLLPIKSKAESSYGSVRAWRNGKINDKDMVEAKLKDELTVTSESNLDGRTLVMREHNVKQPVAAVPAVPSEKCVTLAPSHVNPLTTGRPTSGKYTLRDFQLLRTLGTGSFGRVHLIRSKHNGRFYALKVLRKKTVVRLKQVEHTNDERKMLSVITHPFIIRLWGTFQTSQYVFMVMDYAEGGELFSLLRKSKRFPNPVAKFYAAEICLALEYLHDLNIIYRDLKPENILLDKNGHIKVTDFGFAKYVPDITYTLCGTPDYIAPEVVNTKPYNKSVDWWSFGILIYEMLSGHTPFYDKNTMKTYENIINAPLIIPAYVTEDAKDILKGLINRELSERLGNLQGGTADVKAHPWFSEVAWEKLLARSIETPYEPPIRHGQGDSSQFDRYAEEEINYDFDGEDSYGDLMKDF